VSGVSRTEVFETASNNVWFTISQVVPSGPTGRTQALLFPETSTHPAADPAANAKLSKMKVLTNQFADDPVAANRSESNLPAPAASNSLGLVPGGSVHPGPELPTTSCAVML
jgi:hypothetical protein